MVFGFILVLAKSVCLPMKAFFLKLLLLTLVLSGCSSTRKMLHDADLLEQSGLRNKAFENYQAIYTSNGDTRALIGMKRVAQGLLEEQFREAQMHCMRGNFEHALQVYESAFAYVEQHRELELKTPAGASDQYESCRTDYANHLYTLAEEAVLADRFDEGRAHLDKLRRFDRANKKAEYLALLCNIIPNYQLGRKAYEFGLFRDAYFHFLEVTRLDATYKDALLLRDECLTKSKISIAYLLIENPKVDHSIETSVGAMIKNAVLGLQDPFVQLLDRENIDQLIAEQMNGMSGLYDEKTVIQAGRLTGARFILTGELVSYEPMNAPQRGIERKAYLGSITSSKKVKYTEYRLGRGLDASFRYQIIDAETGRVYATAIIPFSHRDNVVWADFEGDHSMLYPGEWKWQLISSKEDVVFREKREELMDQFNGRKGPISDQDIRGLMMNYHAAEVAIAVKKFRP